MGGAGGQAEPVPKCERRVPKSTNLMHEKLPITLGEFAKGPIAGRTCKTLFSVGLQRTFALELD